MADKNPGKLMVPPSGGMISDIVKRIKLVARLMGDRRVSVFLKLLPLAGIAYWILPLPLDSAIPVIDDLTIFMLGSTVFVELCPPKVVKEHQAELESNFEDEGGEVVDAEATDVNDK